jgi:DNA-binding response OmpR family regulator
LDSKLVEDDPVVRELLRRWLAGWGFAVDVAGDAMSGLEAMLRQPADIAVVDIGMPGHNGLWFAERMRADSPRTSIVIVTGVADVEMIMKARQLGAVDYIVKPFKREMLRQALDRAELKIRQSTDPA